MKIHKATAKYEAWLGRQITPIAVDLESKHEEMRKHRFPFLRATYYRWAQVFPEVCEQLNNAPEVLAVGDLHVENFGTWRDSEGRLIWGVNDFDEAWHLPYTNDLARLAASAAMAIEEEDLRLDAREASQAMLEGYRESLERGGRAFVLAENHPALHKIATHRLDKPEKFWQKLDSNATIKKGVPSSAERALRRMLPDRGIEFRIVHRVSGLGSRGRQRFVAIGEWHGGKVAREAKAVAVSACAWAANQGGSGKIFYQELLDGAVRCRDPFVRLQGRWIMRRLAPDCSRIELASLPHERDELRLLYAMGFETANVHLARAQRKAVLQDLKKRPQNWLHEAAHRMVDAVTEDWEEWRRPNGR
jgi:hypothetical protein